MCVVINSELGIDEMNVVKPWEPLNLGDRYMTVNVELYYALYLSVRLKFFIISFKKKNILGLQACSQARFTEHLSEELLH